MSIMDYFKPLDKSKIFKAENESVHRWSLYIQW